MTQRCITTVYNGPAVAKFLRTRQLNQDVACSDFSEHQEPRRYSLPAVVSKGGGNLGQPFLHRLALFFSRKRSTEQHQSDSPFL
jgi:hypothetical protein